MMMHDAKWVVFISIKFYGYGVFTKIKIKK